MKINEVTSVIIEEAIRVHRALGPGLLESVYEEILYYCLVKRGLQVTSKLLFPFILRK